MQLSLFLEANVMKLFSKTIRVLFGITLVRASTVKGALNDSLLEKAMPLEQYERQVIASGGEPFRHKLGLGSDQALTDKRDLENSYYAGDDSMNYSYGSDDYFKIENILNFNGYALKYATCQKVQRYSVNAVQRGDYSSMATDDIVILRLCPKHSCYANSQYGCSSGYGEYAIDVSQYMTILMKYQADKEKRLCDFCYGCAENATSSANYDDDLYANQTYSNAYQSSSSNACYSFSSQCNNVLSSCNADDDSNSSSVDYTAYQDYFGCQENNDYWVSPHCDPRSYTIEMGVFFDKYCDLDAGDSISVSDFLGDDFDSDAFVSAQEDVSCLDCSSSVSYIGHIIDNRNVRIPPNV